MEKHNSLNQKAKFVEQIRNLQTKYKDIVQCGVFFKLGKNKNPLEILGVLDFLKDKFKKWGNTNIFTYLGDLFKDNIVRLWRTLKKYNQKSVRPLKSYNFFFKNFIFQTL